MISHISEPRNSQFQGTHLNISNVSVAAVQGCKKFQTLVKLHAVQLKKNPSGLVLLNVFKDTFLIDETYLWISFKTIFFKML